jgi:GT2 family glycosyltransferase
MDVSILILTYNRKHLASKYIPKIVENIGSIEAEVLIWDNGSVDGSYDWVYTYAKAAPVIKQVFGSTKNIGMEGINYLAKEASGKYLIKVDDDIDVPNAFAQRLVDAYEETNETKLLFLSWDMPWSSPKKAAGKTFATRSGMHLYKEPNGKTVKIAKGGQVLIHYDPSFWMVNGACRLCPRDTFLEIGGHPKGIIYGVDKHISIRAAEHGYWIGYYNTNDFVYHRGVQDLAQYRRMKDYELHRVGSPKDV